MSAVILIYFIAALILTIYGINTHILVQLFKGSYPKRTQTDKAFLAGFYDQDPFYRHTSNSGARLPSVTTQLPVFNELNVVERLIDAVAEFHYPEGCHEIQLLDDSTDETRMIVAEKVRLLQRQGIDIHHITRKDRTGFKAGALREGLARARGDFVAIFDADFVPPRDFLLRAMPFFIDQPKLGLVQARWGHLNQNDSWVTRLQAVGINGHFMVEQGARSANRLFMNFNGTAGIIRKEAIIDAGNWQGDTLTEDMDLSYRMQLCGWECRYLIDLVAPAEIPRDLNAFKSQQFRWAKGSTQTAIKLMPRIWRSSFRPFAKFQAFMHMSHYIIHPLMLTLAILAPFLLLQKTHFLTGIGFVCFGGLLLLSCTGPSRMYLVAEHALGRPYRRTLCLLPFMVCFGCGLAINNSRAVVEALLGKTSTFVRTPKSGGLIRKRYRVKTSPLIFLEILVGIWCLFGVGLYFDSHHYLIGHFMLIYAVGFLSIGGISWYYGRGTSPP
ncbi:MAG: glycosyltransferase [Deltaproteobacteria bacterium]|jgi:cellulose synthase/poly-beta-1,6-N-acetylglucosamine synthase-like glycosyltransferase|nr:glycosyltransferase [Deltaproteobacteria bacterium]